MPLFAAFLFSSWFPPDAFLLSHLPCDLLHPWTQQVGQCCCPRGTAKFAFRWNHLSKGSDLRCLTLFALKKQGLLDQESKRSSVYVMGRYWYNQLSYSGNQQYFRIEEGWRLLRVYWFLKYIPRHPPQSLPNCLLKTWTLLLLSRHGSASLKDPYHDLKWTQRLLVCFIPIPRLTYL